MITTRRRYARALMWTAYVVVPCRGLGLVHGVPLGPLEAFALLLIWWLALLERPIPGARIAGGAALATLLVSIAVPGAPGFRARYYADADARGAIERSTEYGARDFTRVDERLDFSREGPELPLAFFNDNTRFNFYNPGEPERDKLAFAVVWDGNWWTESDGAPHTLYLDAPRAPAELVVDGVIVAAVTPSDGPRTGVAVPRRGWHQVYIHFSSPYGAPRRFSAGEQIGNRRMPFAGTSVWTRRIDRWQLTLLRLFDVAKATFDVCALGLLVWLVAGAARDIGRRAVLGGSPAGKRGRVGALFGLVAIIEACVFASAWAGRLWLQPGGDDPLTYEFYAREIQLNGLLMRFLDGTYHSQPFYPYFLAATHAVFGEGMFGIMLVQRLLVGLVAWMLVDIAVSLAGIEIWATAFGCSALFAYWKLAPISAKLLNESVFIPLLVAWTAASQRVSRLPTGPRALGVGVLGGVTALARSTALLAWACVYPLCWVAWKHTVRRGRFAAVLLVSSCAVFALLAARNWFVVHEFAPTPNELPVTLLEGNEPPSGLKLDPSRHRPLYDRFKLHPFTRQVVEYALTAPGSFAFNLGRKALFALGFYEPYAPGWGYSVAFIAIWAASIAGFVVAMRARAAPPITVSLPAIVALSQAAAVVVVFPKGERLILPFYAVLIPYAAVAVHQAFRAASMAKPRAALLIHRLTANSGIGGAVLVAAVSTYTFAIRTRGISDHFLMLSEQARDWTIALGPFSHLPLVGAPSTAGGNGFGPVYYWVLWLIRVTIGPFFENLPHAGGIGLAAAQSIADAVLCVGIRKASGSWMFAVATVLIIASSPFDLALSSVIWNPVLAVTFAKIGVGLLLTWRTELTRPRRLALFAVAWLAVQAHSPALPVAMSIFLWLVLTHARQGVPALLRVIAEAACVVIVLQIPSALAPASIQPTKVLTLLLHPQRLRVFDSFRGISAAVEAIAAAPFDLPQTPLIVLGAAAALLVATGMWAPIAVATVWPLVLAVLMWSIWQDLYDSYVFLTIVPSAILMVAWTVRLLPTRTGRASAGAMLLALAALVQKPRIENATLVFRLPAYGALVSGSRAVVRHAEPMRRIEAPFLRESSDPEFIFRILGGRIDRDAPVAARLSERGEVTYVR